MKVKKVIKIDERADKELISFSQEVQAKFFALFTVLEKEGFLKEPFAKKINNNLFEIRVKFKGQWRAIYAYIKKKEIIILSVFNKKTQKINKKEINKAEKRLKEYL
jgi:phage-related protein